MILPNSGLGAPSRALRAWWPLCRLVPWMLWGIRLDWGVVSQVLIPFPVSPILYEACSLSSHPQLHHRPLLQKASSSTETDMQCPSLGTRTPEELVSKGWRRSSSRGERWAPWIKLQRRSSWMMWLPSKDDHVSAGLREVFLDCLGAIVLKTL